MITYFGVGSAWDNGGAKDRHRFTIDAATAKKGADIWTTSRGFILTPGYDQDSNGNNTLYFPQASAMMSEFLGPKPLNSTNRFGFSFKVRSENSARYKNEYMDVFRIYDTQGWKTYARFGTDKLVTSREYKFDIEIDPVTFTTTVYMDNVVQTRTVLDEVTISRFRERGQFIAGKSRESLPDQKNNLFETTQGIEFYDFYFYEDLMDHSVRTRIGENWRTVQLPAKSVSLSSDWNVTNRYTPEELLSRPTNSNLDDRLSTTSTNGSFEAVFDISRIESAEEPIAISVIAQARSVGASSADTQIKLTFLSKENEVLDEKIVALGWKSGFSSHYEQIYTTDTFTLSGKRVRLERLEDLRIKFEVVNNKREFQLIGMHVDVLCANKVRHPKMSTKNQFERLFKRIINQEENPDYKFFSYGPPEVNENRSIQRNTQVLIKAKDPSKYSGDFYIYYDRVSFEEYLDKIQPTVVAPIDITVHPLLLWVNEIYQVNIEEYEVEDLPVHQGEDFITLRATANSYGILPGDELILGDRGYDLEIILPEALASFTGLQDIGKDLLMNIYIRDDKYLTNAGLLRWNGGSGGTFGIRTSDLSGRSSVLYYAEATSEKQMGSQMVYPYKIFVKEGDDWTFETWIKNEFTFANYTLLNMNRAFQLAFTDNRLTLMINGKVPIPFNLVSTLLTRMVWSHIAVSRVNGTIRLFVDGKLRSSFYHGHEAIMAQGMGYVNICPYSRNANGKSGSFGGFLTDIRFNTKTGVYINDFSPPNPPLDSFLVTTDNIIEVNEVLEDPNFEGGPIEEQGSLAETEERGVDHAN